MSVEIQETCCVSLCPVVFEIGCELRVESCVSFFSENCKKKFCKLGGLGLGIYVRWEGGRACPVLFACLTKMGSFYYTPFWVIVRLLYSVICTNRATSLG